MQCAWWEFRCPLTLSNRHLFSLMAPRQPRKPVTMMTEPKVMTRLAAEREGKEGEKVAKLPWETDSHMPTPNNPQPDNWGETDSRECFTLINTQKLIHYGSNTHKHSVQQCFFRLLRFPKCKTDSSVSFTEVSRSQEDLRGTFWTQVHSR